MLPPLTDTFTRVAQLVDSQDGVSSLLLLEDFASCGPEQEVSAALDRLVADDRLAQLREDAFAYTKWSKLFNKLVLRSSLQDLARAYAIRQGAQLRATRAQTAYNAGCKQVPNGGWVGVDRPIEGMMRFRRRTVQYETV